MSFWLSLNATQSKAVVQGFFLKLWKKKLGTCLASLFIGFDHHVTPLFHKSLFFKEFISAIHYALYIIATQDSPITINMDGSWGPIHLNAKIWFHAKVLERCQNIGLEYFCLESLHEILAWSLSACNFGKNLPKFSAWKNVSKFHAESSKFQVFYASGVELIRFWPVVWSGGFIFHWPQGGEKCRHNLKPLGSKILLVQ